jgi:Leucine-rich repeat (LRR) protein
MGGSPFVFEIQYLGNDSWIYKHYLTEEESPPEIGNLTNLINLILDGNNLSGEIPSEIGNLTGLFYLILSENQLTEEIPENNCELSISWSNDSKFNVSNNQLCPPYPSCIEDYIGEQDTSGCN